MNLYVHNHAAGEPNHWVSRLSLILSTSELLVVESPRTSPELSPAICFVHSKREEEQAQWAEFASNSPACRVVFCSGTAGGAAFLKRRWANDLANVYAMACDGSTFINQRLSRFLSYAHDGGDPGALFDEEAFPEYSIAAYLLEKAEINVPTEFIAAAAGERLPGEQSTADVLKRYFPSVI